MEKSLIHEKIVEIFWKIFQNFQSLKKNRKNAKKERNINEKWRLKLRIKFSL